MSSQLQLSLQRAGHGRLTLPVEAQEYGARDFKRRRFRICAVATIAIMLAIFVFFIWAGFFPGLYRGLLTNPPADFGLTLFGFIVALPLGAGLLLFWLISATAPKVVDDTEHPCHYRATEQGISLALVDGRQISAAWDEVRLQSSAEMYFKPGVTALTRIDFLVGDTPITLHVTRLRRRGSRMFLRSLAKHWLATSGKEKA